MKHIRNLLIRLKLSYRKLATVAVTLWMTAMFFITLRLYTRVIPPNPLRADAVPAGTRTDINHGPESRNVAEDHNSFLRDQYLMLNSSLRIVEYSQFQIITCSAGEKVIVGVKKRSDILQVDTPCPERPPTLVGRHQPSFSIYTFHELVAMFPDVQDGGHYTPRMCTPAEKIAIIIPYRNRCRHLYTLLPNLIPMLMRQNVDFTIFVIEQSTPGSFNKGILFNAGYLEALKVDNYDCFVLHDVDMIPIDDRNVYRCNKTGPVHFSPLFNKYNYSKMYSGLFGGVVSFTREQFRRVNGASNLYFGWGAEDDDLRNRVGNKKLPLLRKSLVYGIYDMVNHTGVKEEGWDKNPDRLKIYGTGRLRQDVDGLNSLVYSVDWLRTSQIYTWIGIGFNETAVIEAVPAHLRMADKKDLNYAKAKFIIIS